MFVGTRLERMSKCVKIPLKDIQNYETTLNLIIQKKKVEVTYICELCQGVFKSKTYLKHHMPLHDEDRDLFICGVDGCNKSFSTVGNRQGHIKTAHEGIIVKYPCDEEVCGRTFWHKHLLRKHRQTHAREQNQSEEVEEKEIQHNKKKKNRFFWNICWRSTTWNKQQF